MPSPFPTTAPTALEYFAALVADDASLPLTEAAIAIALDDYPGLDVQRVLAQIDRLARTLRERLPADASAVQKLRLLNRYFFQDLGFAGNVNDYYDPDNSFLHRVLETRRGIPISLSVLYIEIAQQIGLQARGVSFPGHFLVKLRIPQGSQPGEVVIDPFSGQSLSRAELDEQLRPYRQQQGLADDDVPLGLFLQAATSRSVIARMLRNLKEIHRAAGDPQRLLAVCQRLVALMPEDAAERRDRGFAAAQLGQDGLARADLIAYLERTPAAADRDEVARCLLGLGSTAPGSPRPGRGSPRLH